MQKLEVAMEQSINLREYLDILKRRRIIVILVMIICLGLGGYKTYVNYESYVPTYRSSVTVRINSTKNVKKKKKDDTTTNQLDPYSTYNISLKHCQYICIFGRIKQRKKLSGKLSKSISSRTWNYKNNS